MSSNKDDQDRRWIMAIRETLMEYFRGSCVEKLISTDDIQLIKLADYINHGPQWRIRAWEMQQTEPHLLLLIGQPLLTVERPRLTLYTEDEQFKAVREGVKEFMAKYLPKIEVKESKKIPKHEPRPYEWPDVQGMPYVYVNGAWQLRGEMPDPIESFSSEAFFTDVNDNLPF